MDVNKKYFIIAGVSISENISKIENYLMRKDLVDIPSILKYYHESEGTINFYINTMNECIVIAEYSSFSTFEIMKKDYYNEDNKAATIYNKAYENIIQRINNRFKINKTDVDWIMVLCDSSIIKNGKEKIGSWYISVDTLNITNTKK